MINSGEYMFLETLRNHGLVKCVSQVKKKMQQSATHELLDIYIFSFLSATNSNSMQFLRWYVAMSKTLSAIKKLGFISSSFLVGVRVAVSQIKLPFLLNIGRKIMGNRLFSMSWNDRQFKRRLGNSTNRNRRSFLSIYLVFLCYLFSQNANAQEVSISGVWHFSPIIAIPLEGDSIFYQQENSGSLTLTNGGSAIFTQTMTPNNSQTAVGPNVVGGFAATSALSASISGGDSGVALANGFGAGTGANIITQTPHTLNSSSSGTFSSGVVQGADIDATASANAAGDFSVAGASSIIRDLTAVTSATVKTTGPLGPVRTGFTTSNLPAGVDGNFFQSTNNSDSFVAPGIGVSAIGFMANSTNGAVIDITASGANFSATSTLNETAAISILATSAGADTDLRTSFQGNQASINTTANNSVGYQTMISGNVAGKQSFIAQGSNFNVQTAGLQSHGMLLATLGGQSASLDWQTIGPDAQIDTAGNQAHGLIALGSSGGTTTQNIDLGGKNSQITTAGTGAMGVLMNSTAAQSVLNNFVLSGENSNVKTTGSGASGLTIIAHEANNASNRIVISGKNASVETQGIGSNAISSAVNAGSTAQGSLLLSGKNATLKTAANSAYGYLGLFQGTDTAEGTVTLSGAGSSIQTVGDDGVGAMVFAVGNAAKTQGALSGAGAQISTQGQRSGGMVLASLGTSSGLAELQISGQGAKIETSGDFSSGVFLAASGGDSAQTNLNITGNNVRILTSGAKSAGATLASNKSNLVLSGINSSITTTGAGSHAIHLQTFESTTSIGAQFSVLASGAGSDGIYVAPGSVLANIFNAGTISGGRNGIFSAGELNLINVGDINGVTSAGVSLDYGTIFNGGIIHGASAIIASQTTNQMVTIDTPGAIISNAGPTGKAIELQGAGNDLLRLWANTSISGTIQMGAGQDTLHATKGTNADLMVLSPIETITVDRGVVIELNGGLHILIVDPSHYLQHGPAVSSLILDIVSAPHQRTGSPQSGEVLCEPLIDTKLHYGSFTNSSSGWADDFALTLSGFTASLNPQPCNETPLTYFAGYFNGSSIAFDAHTIESDTLTAGLQSRMSFQDNTSLHITAGVARTSGDGTRRIINNTLVPGFEIADAPYSSVAGFTNATLTRWLDTDAMNIGAYLSGDLIYGRLDEISESGVNAPLVMDASMFGSYRVKIGLKANFSEETLENNNKFSIFGDVALSYTESLLDNPIALTVGGNAASFTPDTPNGVGFNAGLGIDIASPNDKLHFMTEFRYAHDSNSESSYSFTTGLKFKM